MLSFFPRGVLDEILNLIESVSEDFPSYSCYMYIVYKIMKSGVKGRNSSWAYADVKAALGYVHIT